jgi:hypothetical protein
MRKTIDGKTYDIKASTEIACHPPHGETITFLYQNRDGAFFAVTGPEDWWRWGDTQNDLVWEILGKDSAKAAAFIKKHKLTVVCEIGGKVLASNAVATILLRLPPILKSLIEVRAEANKQSVNEWFMRVAEEHLRNATKKAQEYVRGPTARQKKLAPTLALRQEHEEAEAKRLGFWSTKEMRRTRRSQ